MWKDVKGWESLYEVSDNGIIRSKRNGKIIIGDKNSAGYSRVTFYNKNHKERKFIHRIVAETYLENPFNRAEINHIDNDKSNNSVNNLEWSNRLHNERECRRTGSKMEIYKPFIVEFENGRRESYEFTSQLGAELNLTNGTIRNFLKGRSKSYNKYGIKNIEYL